MDKCVCGAKVRKIKTDMELFDGDVILKNVDALYCPECKEELMTTEQLSQAKDKYETLLPGFQAFSTNRKIIKVGNSLAVPLPKEIADFMHFSKGKEMRVTVKNRNRLVMDVA